MTESQRRFQPPRPTGTSDSTRPGERVGADPASVDRPGTTLEGRAVIGGRYTVESRLGEGAHAITYRAHDQRLKRTVAIKVLRSHLSGDAELVSRFVREAELAASISHPNVVDVYDVGTDGDVSYIVMRLVPGQDLKHVIQAQGRLPVAQATPLIQQVLRGLGAIHAAGIVHRDVKPQNILITPDGTAQVTDFGVAYAALAEGLTTQGMTVGTASYMAPEQARGDAVTQGTDIYAVGVVFYEMLTGRVPFTGENPMAVMLAHLQSRPTPPSQVVPGLQIPSNVEQIILRAMAKDPAQRFPSTAAMAAALSGAPMPASGEQTTVVGAAARPAMPIGGEQTIVRRSVGAAAQVPPPQRPVTPPWLQDGESGRGAPPAGIASTGSEGRGRGWLVALATLLVVLVAAGAVAAAMQLGPFDRGNDGNATEPAGLVVATTQSTATTAPGGQPTAEATATTTMAVTATPTQLPSTATATVPVPTATVPAATSTVPPPTATARPTATATSQPTATATVAPTDTPEPPPTAAATETPSIVQISPTRAARDDGNSGSGNGNSGNGNSGNGNSGSGNGNSGNGNSGNGNSGSGNGSNNALLLSATGQGVTSITVAPSDWRGAYTNLNTDLYGRDCVALYGQGSGYETASLSFALDGVPANGLTLTISGLDDEYADANPFSFTINGQPLTNETGTANFPQWDPNGSPNFAQLVASFPATVFVDGDNTITITNDAPNGQVNVGPYLLLAEGTLELT